VSSKNQKIRFAKQTELCASAKNNVQNRTINFAQQKKLMRKIDQPILKSRKKQFRSDTTINFVNVEKAFL